MGQSRLSRRELLQRVGLAGAAAWSAPFFSAMPARAAAGRRRRCRRGIDCFGEPEFCTTQCVCATDIDGRLVCVGCVNLDCAGFAKCASNADCPRGSRCLLDACCDVPICVPKCGNPCPAATPTAGRSWTGVRKSPRSR